MPAEKAVTSPFRYKSLKVRFIKFAFITSCGFADTVGKKGLGLMRGKKNAEEEAPKKAVEWEQFPGYLPLSHCSTVRVEDRPTTLTPPPSR